MEQAVRIDIFILILFFLSLLIGYVRGFFVEARRLAVYLLSGVFGYYSIPVFLPVFSSFIPQEQMARMPALALGTFVSWFVLQIVVSLFLRNVKIDRFARLDRSLGAVFGSVRGVVILFLSAFLVSVFSPPLFEESRLMQTSFAGMQTLLRECPALKEALQTAVTAVRPPVDAADGDERQTQEDDWKKIAAEYILNKTVRTKDGEENPVSVASGFIAGGMELESGRPYPPELIETFLRVQLENMAGDKKIQEMTPEEQKLFLQRIMEERKKTE